MAIAGNTPILNHKTDIFEFIDGLVHGDIIMWVALAVLAGVIAFFALHEKVTGRPFVKSKRERRAARERRKHVIWKYERDD